MKDCSNLRIFFGTHLVHTVKMINSFGGKYLGNLYIYTRCSFTFEWNHSVRKLKSVLARIFVCAKLSRWPLSLRLNTSHKIIHVARGTFCIHAPPPSFVELNLGELKSWNGFLFCSLIVELENVATPAISKFSNIIRSSFFERFDSKFIEKLLLLLLCLRNKFVVLSYWKENFLRLEGNIELKY